MGLNILKNIFCINCDWWFEEIAEKDKKTGWGECRRFPPKFCNEHEKYSFPVTRFNCFCGEYASNFDCSIDKIGLSVRTINNCRLNDIYYVRQLASKTRDELKKMHFGKKSLIDVEYRLRELGIEIRG